MQGMTRKQLHKANRVMMTDGWIDVQVVIKLSNISDEKHTYLQGVKA